MRTWEQKGFLFNVSIGAWIPSETVGPGNQPGQVDRGDPGVLGVRGNQWDRELLGDLWRQGDPSTLWGPGLHSQTGVLCQWDDIFRDSD